MDVVLIRVTNDEVRPKNESKIRISNLVNVAAGHANFERLKGTLLKHFS